MVIILFKLLDKLTARDLNSAENDGPILELIMAKNYVFKKGKRGKKTKIRTLITIIFYVFGRFFIRLKWKKRIFNE